MNQLSADNSGKYNISFLIFGLDKCITAPYQYFRKIHHSGSILRRYLKYEGGCSKCVGWGVVDWVEFNIP